MISSFVEFVKSIDKCSCLIACRFLVFSWVASYTSPKAPLPRRLPMLNFSPFDVVNSN